MRINKIRKKSGHIRVVILLVMAIIAVVVTFFVEAYFGYRLYQKNKLLIESNLFSAKLETMTAEIKAAQASFASYLYTQHTTHISAYNQSKKALEELIDEFGRTNMHNEDMHKLVETNETNVNALLLQLTFIISDLEHNRNIPQEIKSVEIAVNRTLESCNKLKELINNRILEIEGSIIRDNTLFGFLRTPLFILFIVLLIIAIVLLNQIQKARTKLFSDLLDKNRELIMDTGNKVVLQSEDKIIDFLNDNLINAINFIKELGNGNYNSEYAGLNTDNIKSNTGNLAGELVLMRDLFRKARNEDEQRQLQESHHSWMNEGEAFFGGLLRQTYLNTQELADTILNNLISFVNATQGGFFIKNDEKYPPVFEMIACYAFDRKKIIQKDIYLGEGLVGTCGIEKQTIFMTHIPPDYLTINSGTGEAVPKSLLIVPLISDNQTIGVIELASFNVFEPHQIQFVEKIAKTIAITVATFRINMQTNLLLTQSKEQTEAMSAQEEEMRQNLEELLATQEESARKSAELEATFDILNEMLGVIEFDLDGTITDANDYITDKLMLNSEELSGKHHIEILNNDYVENDSIQEFWEKLNMGETCKAEHKYTLPTGEQIWMKETFKPIFDFQGSPIKIMALFNDITENKQQHEELLKQTKELKLKEIELQANMDKLKQIQTEVITRKDELEATNKKLLNNESVMKKAIAKSKTTEKELQEKQSLLLQQENQLTHNLNELVKAQEETERKRFEADQSRLLLQFILDNLQVSIYWKDKNLNYMGCNKLFAEKTKLTNTDDIIGKSDYDTPWADKAQDYRDDDLSIIESGKTRINEVYKSKNLDNSTYWLKTSKIPILNMQGEAIGIVGIFEDITAQKLLENKD